MSSESCFVQLCCAHVSNHGQCSSQTVHDCLYLNQVLCSAQEASCTAWPETVSISCTIDVTACRGSHQVLILWDPGQTLCHAPNQHFCRISVSPCALKTIIKIMICEIMRGVFNYWLSAVRLTAKLTRNAHARTSHQAMSRLVTLSLLQCYMLGRMPQITLAMQSRPRATWVLRFTYTQAHCSYLGADMTGASSKWCRCPTGCWKPRCSGLCLE